MQKVKNVVLRIISNSEEPYEERKVNTRMTWMEDVMLAEEPHRVKWKIVNKWINCQRALLATEIN